MEIWHRSRLTVDASLTILLSMWLLLSLFLGLYFKLMWVLKSHTTKRVVRYVTPLSRTELDVTSNCIPLVCGIQFGERFLPMCCFHLILNRVFWIDQIYDVTPWFYVGMQSLIKSQLQNFCHAITVSILRSFSKTLRNIYFDHVTKPRLTKAHVFWKNENISADVLIMTQAP